MLCSIKNNVQQFQDQLHMNKLDFLKDYLWKDLILKNYIFGVIWHEVYSVFYCWWSDMLEAGGIERISVLITF